jgi:sugar phosphate isomerase/epimerase
VRVGGHTYSFRHLPVDQALGRLATTGFEVVELWLGHAETDADAETARAALDRHGLHVAAVSAGGVYDVADDRLIRAGRLARSLGADVVVTCASPPLVPLLADQAGQGVMLAVENHWDQPLARSRDVLAALEAAPALGACLDTGHAINAGESPSAAAGSLGARLVHVHLKDARRPSLAARALGRRTRLRLLGRPAPVAPGSGDLDVEELRDALDRAGFTGTVSLEYEGPDPEPAVAALLARWRAAQAT